MIHITLFGIFGFMTALVFRKVVYLSRIRHNYPDTTINRIVFLAAIDSVFIF